MAPFDDILFMDDDFDDPSTKDDPVEIVPLYKVLKAVFNDK